MFAVSKTNTRSSMSSNTDRYPSRYRDSQKYADREDIDFFCDGPADNYIKNYSIIIKHREEIIDMLNNDNYDDISKLIEHMSSMGNMMYEIPDYSDNDPSPNNKAIKRNVFYVLVKFCYFNNDVELLKILISKSDDYSDSAFLSPLQLDIKSYDYENQEIFRVFIENVNYNEENIRTIIDNIIIFDNNTIIFLDIMAECGYHIDDYHIKLSILRNKIKVVQYAITNNFNVQYVVDKLFYDNLTDKGIGKLQGLYCCDVQILKCLFDNNINLSNNLNGIFFNCAYIGNLDAVMFLAEMFPDIDINSALVTACHKNHMDLMIYLLKLGADINSINNNISLNTNFNMFKFLIESGYLALQFTLDLHLLKCFVNDHNLDNVYYLIKNGSSMEWLINNETPKSLINYHMAKRDMVFRCNWNMVRSPLELVVTANKITHLNFLIDNYFDLIKPHLNRLFIIACANGRTSLAEYLLDLGTEINYEAVESACFFGHLEIVILLLKHGMTFDQCKKNIIDMTIYGKLCCMYETNFMAFYDNILSDIYDKLIKNSDTFRNDIYHYGNDYVDILKLLISYDVKQSCNHIPNLGKLPAEFYDIDIFRYFISGDISDNVFIDTKCIIVDPYFFEQKEERTLLESSIVYEKLDIIEFLLQKGAKGPITNKKAIDKAKNVQPVMNMLMKYEIENLI